MAKVKAVDREKHSATGDGRFPIANRAQALSALRLRGHAKNKAERLKIIRAAAKYARTEAARALEEDRKKGLI